MRTILHYNQSYPISEMGHHVPPAQWWISEDHSANFQFALPHILDALKSKSVECPRCGQNYRAGLIGYCYGIIPEEHELILVCSNHNCSRPFIVTITNIEKIDSLDFDKMDHPLHSFPPNIAKYDSVIQQWKEADIPNLAIEAYHEGIKAWASGYYRAACVMFRGSLEKIVEIKSPEGFLEEKIKNHPDLEEELRRRAHKIRTIGNSHAHIDKDVFDNATSDDTNKIKKYLEDIAAYLFINPHQMGIPHTQHLDYNSAKTFEKDID